MTITESYHLHKSEIICVSIKYDRIVISDSKGNKQTYQEYTKKEALSNFKSKFYPPRTEL